MKKKAEKISETLNVKDGFFTVKVVINEEEKEWKVRPQDYLLDVLRREGYKGAKRGCETGDCGSCTVLIDGTPALSCLILAVQAHGRKITTIEGVGSPSDPHPIQTAFVEAGAVQCGFCIPGMILSAKALLDGNPDPDELQIRRAIDGNLCRCTGYVKQVEAVKLAAKAMKKTEG